MDLNLKSSSKFVFTVLFFCIFTGIVCQINNSGLCYRRFSAESSYNETNVVFVCTNSSTASYTDVVYFDTATAPTQAASNCSCRITFRNNLTNRLKLLIEAENTSNLTVRGFGATFRASNASSFITESGRDSILIFSVITGVRSHEACLRMMKLESSNTSFQAACFQSDFEPQSPVHSSTLPSQVLEENTPEVPEENHRAGAMIGGSVGGAVLVALLVILIVILIKRRKRTTGQKEEDYYMEENAMYNKPADTPQKLSDQSPVTNDYQLTHDYDIIQSAYKNKYGTDYSVVDKGKATSNTSLGTQQKVQENEYNHLNEIPAIAATGNVYSSTGNRDIESNPEDFYNCTTNSVQKSSAQSKITENVYDTTT